MDKREEQEEEEDSEAFPLQCTVWTTQLAAMYAFRLTVQSFSTGHIQESNRGC